MDTNRVYFKRNSYNVLSNTRPLEFNFKMIELKFDINKLASTDIEGIPREDLLSVISETYFLLPVQLTVNGKIFFKKMNILIGLNYQHLICFLTGKAN